MSKYKLTQKTDANGNTQDIVLDSSCVDLSDYIKKGVANTLTTTTTLNTSIPNTFTICRQTSNGGAFIDYAGNNQTAKYWRAGCGGWLDFEIYSGNNGANTKVFNITSAGNVAVTGSISEGGTSLVNKYEAKSNKVTSLSSSSTDTEYPSAKCVYDMIGDVESLLTALNTGVGV